MNNAVFGKKLWKIWEKRDTKPVTTERRRNYLGSELSFCKVSYRNFSQ